ncbi:unnamed protein product [Haemonchus placei]|uniref:5_nucleotid_C domain-containing protein n=1 Tax=Haemonchus placei TaxID=6290 RepID=A0A0N4WS06_HAEPC|nr:unnamed protein product [Haemonchus placei]
MPTLRQAETPLSQRQGTSKTYNMSQNEANAEHLSAERFSELVQEFDTFICGADGLFGTFARPEPNPYSVVGLLWLREGVITDASKLINRLVDNKKQVIILTNDTTTTRADHEKKLADHRFSPKITKDVIVTPGLIVANYIKNFASCNGKKVYIIAAEGVQYELKDNGIGSTRDQHPEAHGCAVNTANRRYWEISTSGLLAYNRVIGQQINQPIEYSLGASLTTNSNFFVVGIEYFGQGPDILEPQGKEVIVLNTDLAVKREEVCAVVVGFDKHFNYKKMMKAANYLRDPSCLFLATNDDATFSCQNQDIVVPDAGMAQTTKVICSATAPCSLITRIIPSETCHAYDVNEGRRLLNEFEPVVLLVPLMSSTNSKVTQTLVNSNLHNSIAGAIVASVSKASTREPVIVGKPYLPAFEFIKSKWKINESRTMMICSRISTDVKFGRDHGLRTLLILNETQQLDELEKLRSTGQVNLLPHYYATSIASILP